MKKIMVILCIALGIAIGCFIYFKDDKKEEEITYTEDEIQFKKDYNVVDNNNVKYLTDEGTLNFLTKGTGVLYIGNKDSKLCQEIVPILLTATNNYGMEQVFYFDLSSYESKISIEDNKVKIDKGSIAYYDILYTLDSYLNDYKVTINKKKVSTGEKRITSPTVIIVNEGKIEDYHINSVDSHEIDNDEIPSLTKDQKEELYGIYSDMVSKVSNSSCNDGCE